MNMCDLDWSGVRMKTYSGVTLFFVLSALGASSGSSGEANADTSNLLFKSGFEDGVYLETPTPDEGGIWWQKIRGSDVDGFEWPI